uniref:Conotoxin pc3a n=1 Tax=Conus pictus TaxID=1042615 RepID=CM3A_CONPB|nr:RecName: Full=Conotoxin pc3a [Conus pictus]
HECCKKGFCDPGCDCCDQ